LVPFDDAETVIALAKKWEWSRRRGAYSDTLWREKQHEEGEQKNEECRCALLERRSHR
jgi:hypothetical protein